MVPYPCLHGGVIIDPLDAIGRAVRHLALDRQGVERANLSNAKLDGAKLQGVRMAGAIWIDGKTKCKGGSVGRCEE